MSDTTEFDEALDLVGNLKHIVSDHYVKSTCDLPYVGPRVDDATLIPNFALQIVNGIFEARLRCIARYSPDLSEMCEKLCDPMAVDLDNGPPHPECVTSGLRALAEGLTMAVKGIGEIKYEIAAHEDSQTDAAA